MKVVAGGFRFDPFPSFSFAKRQVAGIGHDRVLVFGFSGIMISIKSIDVHIGHDSSVGVCFAKRSQIYRIGNRHFDIFFPRFPRVGGPVGLVLVFAAKCKEMALRPVLENKMSNILKCRSKFEKIRMDYSCHRIYKGIHIVCSSFSLLS